MIVWSGKGGATLLLLSAFYLLLVFLDSPNSFIKVRMDDLSQMGYATLMAAPFVWVLGKRWNKVRLEVDKKTGEEYYVKPNHTFFWIPMEYWGIIYIVVGLSILVFK